MKAMKSMNVNRMLGSFKRKPRDGETGGAFDPTLDTPEANAARSVRSFCESGGPNGTQGEEVLYLPTIVESCESSPSAAKEASYAIRKFLSKDNYSKPYMQYNSIMLIRILADNPGKTFTRNIDTKFVQTVKDLLRNGRDPSVKQILMETLDTFQRQKTDDEGLNEMNEMWKKEQEKMAKIHGPAGARPLNAPSHDRTQNYFSRNHHSRRLPPPHELVSRIEEAKTSAQLLSQTCQSTPPSELLQNELVREFADRCTSASRSIQAYMISEDPSPDNDTMETLIETNELLNKSMNQHQRAVLNARKVVGLGTGEGTSPPLPVRLESDLTGPPGPSPNRTESGFAAPPGPPPNASTQRKAPPVPPPGDFAPMGEDEDPFKDPTDQPKPPFPADKAPLATGQFNDQLGIEPWHPGFKETQSYVGRQDSSVGNLTMHAAAPVAELESPVEKKDDGSGFDAPKKTVYRY